MTATTRTILVVDDDEGVAEIIRQILEERGYRVFSSVDGDALVIAAREQPALILLDLMMPRMDGGTVSQRLKADPATAAIPLVITSAWTQDSPHATRVRYDGWLNKPFDLDDLCAVVRRYVD